MKEPWPQEWQNDIIEVSKKWIKGNLNAQEIRDNIGDFDWAVAGLLPKLKNKVYASNSLNILIDDIMEMDSISDEEKNEAIIRLYNRRKEELKSLARKIIKQIEINHKEFVEEAEERGYCPILTKEQ